MNVNSIRKQKANILNSDDSSVRDRKVHKTPPGRFDPESHHSIEAKFKHYHFSHENQKVPEELSKRRQPLKLPQSAQQWEELDKLFEEAYLKSKSRGEHPITKLASFLYDFIRENVPQNDSKTPDKSTNKNRHVLKLKRKLVQNRLTKKFRKQYVKKLKSSGCFKGDVAIEETRVWHKLLKSGNRLREKLKKAKESLKQRRANKRFRADPHKFAKDLFNDSKESKCGVSKDQCEEYFPKLYKDDRRDFRYSPMPGMKRPPPPEVKLHMKAPTQAEFYKVLYAKRNAAAPGRDGIPYVVYKKLPAAGLALFRAITANWKESIPVSWAQAAVVLIYKDDDPSDPSNYRPIALTSCSGKIFFSLWAKRLEQYMLKNKYFKRSKQKGFLHGISGCTEHISLLKAAFKDAKKHQRQIVVSWIDLKNAFGSVSHNLIQFAMKWYHIPEEFAEIIFAYYNMLRASIVGKDWSTKPFAYDIGVFQGCVISPLLFNLVFNLLLDCLAPNTGELGYNFKDDAAVVYDMAYADDLSIVTKTPDQNQHSLDLIDKFLSWTRTMAAKPKKCRSVAFKQWSEADEKKGRVRMALTRYTPYDPKLSIAGKLMKFIENESFKFLGWEVYHNLSESKQKEQVQKYFEYNMKLVDNSDIHGFMKLWIYQHYVVLYLAWPFTVYDLDVSWVTSLQKIATRYLKKWAGIYRNGVVSLLYRPRSKFGLQLHALVNFYKRMQVNKAILLKYSPDTPLNIIYSTTLSEHRKFSRVWKPEPLVEELESKLKFQRQFAGQMDRKGLGSVPGRYTPSSPKHDKDLMADMVSDMYLDTLVIHDMELKMQNCFLRFKDVQPFDLSWNHLIGTYNPRLITWVLNASINSAVTPDLCVDATVLLLLKELSHVSRCIFLE